MEYLSEKYNIEIMKKQSKFEKDYPLMMKRIEALEQELSAGIRYNNDYIDHVLDKKEGTD
jgi:hypothetical protein